MTRYSEVLELVQLVDAGTDEEGNQVIEEVVTTVFANRFTLGLQAWAAAQSYGLHADAQFNVRSADYEGQERVRHCGAEYEVEKAVDTGEFTRLTLSKRLNNV